MSGKSHSVELPDYRSCEIGKTEQNDLSNIAGLSINELCKRNSKLLVFPNSLGRYSDGINDKEECICKIAPKFDAEGEYELCTEGVLGFVGYGETELTIHSRFAEHDENDFFLHYMVQKVFNINLFDLKHSTAEDRVFDFLLCLFPKYLKDALKQGLYKQYVVNKYNDSNVRGMIDVARHIKKNIPFAGKVAYNVREYSYDNNITQLIRHTIEYIRSSNMSKVLKQDDDTETYISQICAATPSYKSRDRSRIISKNLKTPTSPYYLGYIPLQKLCVQILTHKKLKYGDDDDNQIYGLLFIGNWVWEEFLYKTLADCGFKHYENRVRESEKIWLFTNKRFPRYPDYYNTTSSFILDAKYKHMENKNVERDDMHQVISYMYVLNARKGGFIFPYAVDKKGCEIDKQDLGELNGYGGEMHVIGVPIFTKASKYDEFQNEMTRIECDLKRKIIEICNMG